MTPPPAVLAQLAPHLEPGERVLWSGGPDSVAMLRSQLGLWWVGIPLTTLGVVVALIEVLAPPYDMVPIIIGGVFLAAPFVMVAVATGTIYAITDRRALIKRDAVGVKSFAGYPFALMDDRLEILETGQGAGHLYFAAARRKDRAQADHTGRIAFRALARPREVAAVLDRIRAGQPPR